MKKNYQSITKNIFQPKFTVICRSTGVASSSFVTRVTFPNRTKLGVRLEGTQCAAVNTKYSEITVPPQSKLTPSEN